MLVEEKDAEAVVKLPLSIKKRLLTNEKFYRQNCPQPEV
jgi:hypothetical protein